MIRRLLIAFTLTASLGLGYQSIAQAQEAPAAAEAGPGGVGTSPAPMDTVGAPAAEAPADAAAEPSAGDPAQAVSDLVRAIQGGTWLPALAAMLVLLVWVLRRWGRQFLPWLGTDRGGVALVLGTSFLAALASSLSSGGAFGFAEVEAALLLAVTAIGGYQGLRRLLWPRDRAS